MDEPSKAPPYMPLWVDDFEAGTLEMTDAELGAYVRLLLTQWRRGHVDPSRPPRTIDPGNLAAVLAWKFQEVAAGRFQNARCEQERARVAKRSAAASKNGRKGGRPPGGEKANSKPAKSSPDPRSQIPDSLTQNSGPDSNYPDRAGPLKMDRTTTERALVYGRAIARQCGVPGSTQYRRRLAAAAILTATELTEAWLGDVLAGMRATAPHHSPYARLLVICRERCQVHFGEDFDRLASTDALVIPAGFYRELDRALAGG